MVPVGVWTINRESLPLKGTVSRDFRPFFGLKDLTWAPYEQAKTVLRNFWFRGDIWSQTSKIGCPHSQRLGRHPICYLDTDIFIFFIIDIAMKYIQILFLPDCSFKICEKPSKFTRTRNFRKYQIPFFVFFLLVFSFSKVKSFPVCQRSRWLDYVDTMAL